MSESRGLVRGLVVLAALLLTVIAGLCGVFVTDRKTELFWGTGPPHPLQSWYPIAKAGWLVTGMAVIGMTWWGTPRKRFAAQLVLPVAALGAWLVIVAIVDDYPMTLRAEWNGSRWTASTAQLDPGYQRFQFVNNTAFETSLRILRIDQASPPRSNPSAGGTAQNDRGKAIRLSEPGCFILACSDPTVEYVDRESSVTLDLSDGYYAITCDRDDGTFSSDYPVYPYANCSPAFFSVGTQIAGAG